MRQMVKKHIIPGSYKKAWVPTFSLSLNNLIWHYDCNGKPGYQAYQLTMKFSEKGGSINILLEKANKQGGDKTK